MNQSKESTDSFTLPVVAGRKIKTSNADFERACLIHIDRLQSGMGPYDSAMLDTFCEAVRLAREYSDSMGAPVGNDVKPDHAEINVEGRKITVSLFEFEVSCLHDLKNIKGGMYPVSSIVQNLTSAVRLARQYKDECNQIGLLTTHLTTYALAVVMSKVEPKPQGGFNTIERLLVGYRKCTSKDEAVGSFITKAFADNRGFNAGEVVAIVVP